MLLEMLECLSSIFAALVFIQNDLLHGEKI